MSSFESVAVVGLLIASFASANAVTGEPTPDKTRPGASPQNVHGLPQLLIQVEAKYAKEQTLKAEFSQVNFSAALKQKKTVSGIIMFKRPDKIRWETKIPDPNVLVSDGKKVWFYTPPFDEGERGQLIEKKSTEVQTKLTNALLSGSFSAAHDLKIEQKSTSHFVLYPKTGTAGTVVRAEIDIDPERKLIHKVTLKHRDGNQSEITLSGIELGKPLEDEVFRFKAPANTDRIDPNQ